MLASLNRPTIVWLILMAATAVSFESSVGSLTGHAVATSAILLVAFVKLRLVGLEYMELRHAPLIFRIGFELWAVGIFAAMLILYWIGGR